MIYKWRSTIEKTAASSTSTTSRTPNYPSATLWVGHEKERRQNEFHKLPSIYLNFLPANCWFYHKLHAVRTIPWAASTSGDTKAFDDRKLIAATASINWLSRYTCTQRWRRRCSRVRNPTKIQWRISSHEQRGRWKTNGRSYNIEKYTSAVAHRHFSASPLKTNRIQKQNQRCNEAGGSENILSEENLIAIFWAGETNSIRTRTNG